MSEGRARRRPPPGVESRPRGAVVPLAEAATRLNKDPRTLIRAITDGVLRGGALPRPERLRWYVYEDALPPLPSEPTPPAPTPPAAEPPDGTAGPLDDYVGDLRAQLVNQMELNRALLAAQESLLAGEEGFRELAEQYRELAEKYREVLERYRAGARQYVDVLTQFATPGHLIDLGLDL